MESLIFSHPLFWVIHPVWKNTNLATNFFLRAISIHLLKCLNLHIYFPCPQILKTEILECNKLSPYVFYTCSSINFGSELYTLSIIFIYFYLFIISKLILNFLIFRSCIVSFLFDFNLYYLNIFWRIYKQIKYIDP